jgi:hypothetical protein
MASALYRLTGPEQQLAWRTGGEPAQSGFGHGDYFIGPCHNVKSMTPDSGIFLQKHANYIK